MPSWGDLLKEIAQVAQSGPSGVSPFDLVRRKYLAELYRRTGRNVILYASKWTQGGADPSALSIGPEDVQGFMEVMDGLTGAQLDLIVHLPGGSAEATEALVQYLRSQFDDIRVIIPHAAMSAATMLACAANRILMGRHSFIGPIDPQFILKTELGAAIVPAHAILEQFELAKKECKDDPALLATWLPIIRQYGPALIIQCRYADMLSKSLVSKWLEDYMFAGDPQAGTKASQTADALGNHAEFKTHNRFIDRESARKLGLVIEDLEIQHSVQEAVLSVFHATIHTLNGTPTVKVIESHMGKAFLKQQHLMMIPGSGAPPPAALPARQPPAGP